MRLILSVRTGRVIQCDSRAAKVMPRDRCPLLRHLEGDDRDLVIVEAMGEEAVTTSRIEGEVLDRDSVQSSIRLQLGLSTDRRSVTPGEQGIAGMMVHLLRQFANPLDDTWRLASSFDSPRRTMSTASPSSWATWNVSKAIVASASGRAVTEPPMI